jgi:sucrose phosphorylase
VVQHLLDLIRLRNTHPAFAGQAQVESPSNHTLTITWKQNAHLAKLDVDFAEPGALITYSTPEGIQQRAVGILESSVTKTGSTEKVP